jgi:thioredoxin 1
VKLLKFYTPWCGPCKAQTMLLNEVDLTGVELTEIDCEIDPITASKHRITSVPTLVFIKDNKEVARFTGLTPPENIEEVIKDYA